MYRWSKIRVKLEKEYLAPSLRGRIQYFAVSYSKSPDHIGRAAVKLDGREILKSSYWLAYSAFDDAFAELRSDNVCSGENDLWHMACKRAIDKGGFDQLLFYRAFDEFDNQSIEKALTAKIRLSECLLFWTDEQVKDGLKSLRKEYRMNRRGSGNFII